MKRRKHRTDSERQSMVEQVSQLMEGGTPTKDACQRIGIHSSQFYEWRRKLDDAPTQIISLPRAMRTTNGAKKTERPVNQAALVKLLVEASRWI